MGSGPVKPKDLCCMKVNHFCALLGQLTLLAGLSSCDDFARLTGTGQTGELRWILEGSALTKASAEIPDTNDFLLSIYNADGEVLYEGSYGDSPEYLPVSPGNYTLKVVSVPFTEPAFSRPQYGDEQVVLVKAGESVTVKLECTLLNAGIRLKIAADFLTSYPDGVLFVQQNSKKLKYGYLEKRIAYMAPGNVSLVLYNQSQNETLFTRSLEPREILTLSVSAPSAAGSTGSHVQIAVDTSKCWTNDSYIIGGDNGGDSDGDTDEWQQAISVANAASHVGENDVWVYGYIVGGDLTSAGKSVKTSGLSKQTHLAIASRSSITTKASCVAVELPKGSVRDALNLVDHPELVGSRIYVKGNLVSSYFGTTGLKGTSQYHQ